MNETGCVHIAGSAFSGGSNWGGRECTTSPCLEGHIDKKERCEEQETAAVRQAVLDGELQGMVSHREFEAFCAERMERGGGAEVDRLVLTRCEDRLEAEGLLTPSEDGEVVYDVSVWLHLHCECLALECLTSQNYLVCIGVIHESWRGKVPFAAPNCTGAKRECHGMPVEIYIGI